MTGVPRVVAVVGDVPAGRLVVAVGSVRSTPVGTVVDGVGAAGSPASERLFSERLLSAVVPEVVDGP